MVALDAVISSSAPSVSPNLTSFISNPNDVSLVEVSFNFTFNVPILNVPFLPVSVYNWIFPSSPFPCHALSVVNSMVALEVSTIEAEILYTSSFDVPLTLQVAVSFIP